MDSGGMIFLALAVVITSVAVAWLVSKMITAPLERITQGITRLSMGKFDEPVEGGPALETAELAEKINHMAGELSGRITAGASETQSGEAILACIEEGVLAVDQDRKIIRLNPKARQVLGIPASKTEGLSLDEVLRHGELARFIDEGLASRTPEEKDILMAPLRERLARVARSPLYRPNGDYWGLVVTIRDVTRLRRLENLRKDFAANVSHELRTPVTSIKGFVETLRAGAVKSPEKAAEFLKIIERHIERLTAIIEDLLSLSRIERDSETGAVPFRIAPVKEALDKAVEDAAVKAGDKKVEIEIDCDKQLLARINAPLLESAVYNLIDNAINYSERGGKIMVSAALEGGVLSIHVRDYGCGIEKEHLERIFERFYRVDDARSRKLGGTGLGLSIVKHIALAHGGRVTVDSAPGEGSVFSIHIPVENSTGKEGG